MTEQKADCGKRRQRNESNTKRPDTHLLAVVSHEFPVYKNSYPRKWVLLGRSHLDGLSRLTQT